MDEMHAAAALIAWRGPFAVQLNSPPEFTHSVI
jgi:hypothetical protein